MSDANDKRRRLVPTFTVEDCMNPRHPMFELVVPWSSGAYTYRGMLLSADEYAAAKAAFIQQMNIVGDSQAIFIDVVTWWYNQRGAQP